MTKTEYHHAVTTFDQTQALRRAAQMEAEIAGIPLNVNRAGKHYRKLLQEIINKSK